MSNLYPELDKTVIPIGDHCYRVVPINEGEVLSDDLRRFGKDLREFTYHKGYKEILCPYWQRTDYGTVRCNYLDIEVVDDSEENAHELIQQHFKDSDAVKKLEHSWALPDEIKVCGIREDE